MFVIRFFAVIREILAKTAKAKFNVYQASKFSAANKQNALKICHHPKLAEFKTRKFDGKTSLVRLLSLNLKHANLTPKTGLVRLLALPELCY